MFGGLVFLGVRGLYSRVPYYYNTIYFYILRHPLLSYFLPVFLFPLLLFHIPCLPTSSSFCAQSLTMMIFSFLLYIQSLAAVAVVGQGQFQVYSQTCSINHLIGHSMKNLVFDLNCNPPGKVLCEKRS